MVVPGVGTLPPDKWQDDTGAKWLETIDDKIGAEAPGLAVYAFSHGLNASDHDLWESLLRSSGTFLNDLMPTLREHKVHQPPGRCSMGKHMPIMRKTDLL